LPLLGRDPFVMDGSDYMYYTVEYM